MTRRLAAVALLVWALGFVWFAAALPQPAAPAHSDAVVVLTGSEGRIARGLEVLEQQDAAQMLVSGVDPDVRPGEFQAEYQVSDAMMACCITLGFAAIDTKGNASETAQWVAQRGYRSIRLVTSDWHMRRAMIEMDAALPADIAVTRDAVRSEVTLWTLFLEYHKFLAVWLLGLLQ
jgi:uncharacterized SAM-binding protein YcdF (DUF218 family)